MAANEFAYQKLCSLFYDAMKNFASEQELGFYLQFINKTPGRILEAMTGTGRIQIPLMRMGYEIDGVDRSPIMLDRCRLRSKEFGLTPNLYQQSLEELDLPHTYQTVIIAVASFQLIIDKNIAQQALQKLHAHMLPGGTLLIDIFTPYHGQDISFERIARLNETQTIKMTTRHVYDVPNKQAQAFCHFQLYQQGLVIEEDNELLEMTWYDDEEFKIFCAQAGFKLVQIHEEQFPNMAPARIAELKRL